MWLWDSVIRHFQVGVNDFSMIPWSTPGPSPSASPGGSSVPEDLSRSSSFQASHPACLPWPFLPAAILVKCLTRPCSGLSLGQNQHLICTSGFFRADPKISIYPDVDILMSNGQSSEDTLLVAEQDSESHSEFESRTGTERLSNPNTSG